MEQIPAADSQADWVALMLREFSRSQATGFMLDVAKGVFLGAGLGLLVAIVVCWCFSRLGWYEMQNRFARGFRWTLYALISLLTLLFFGVAGFWSGALGGAERVLSKSQLASDAFPQIAEVIADGMAWVQLQSESPADTNAIARGIELFRQGERELNAATFPGQFDALREETIRALVTRLEQTALERTPQLKGGLTEKLLHGLLNGLGRVAVEKKTAKELKSWGADHLYVAIRTGLLEEARRTGDAETINRKELTTFIVHQGIVPGILKPIRTMARAQQLPLLALAGLTLVAPPICIRFVRRRRTGTPTPNPPLATPPKCQPPV
jgi:hypothetical protein